MRPGRAGRGLSRRPGRGRGYRCPPAGGLAQGRGQLHQGSPKSPVHRQDRRPRHGRQLLGSVRWLKNRRAHASSHYVVARRGRIVQLVHLRHRLARGPLGHERAVGRDRARGLHLRPGRLHRGAQYRASDFAAWIARRGLMPIDRTHLIGHADVPDGRGGRGGSSPPHRPRPALELGAVPAPRAELRRRRPPEREAAFARGPLRGIVSWRAKASPDIKQVEFIVDGRVVHVDRRAASRTRSTRPSLRTAATSCRCTGSPAQAATTSTALAVLVDNKTSRSRAPARPWMLAPSTIRRARAPWGQKAAKMNFTVDGRTRAVDRARPSSSRGHALREAGSPRPQGRGDLRRRPHRRPADPRGRLPPKAEAGAEAETCRSRVPLAIVGQSVQEGQELSGSSSGASTRTCGARGVPRRRRRSRHRRRGALHLRLERGRRAGECLHRRPRGRSARRPSRRASP